MIVPRPIQQNFANQENLVQSVALKVRDTLQEYCSTHGYIFDGRAKSIESLAEKIESGRFRRWIDIDDLYACTIAVPLPSDEHLVLEFLKKTFEEVSTKQRLSARKPPDAFRLDNTRFVARLKGPPGLEQTGSIYTISFEVQIKTIFELAWSGTTHALAYKSSRVDWRALRLAAALKASVEQIDLLLSDFENAMKGIREAPWREIEKKKQIQDLFLSSEIGECIPSEVWPKDLSRFIDNCFSAIELLQLHLRRRSRRDRGLDIYDEALDKVRAFVRAHRDDLFPRSVSMFQIVLGVLCEHYDFPPDEEMWFPITRELETLFPRTRNVMSRFELE